MASVDLWYFLILALLGVIGGLLSGLIGVGGGVFFVPALVYAVGWGIKEAVAASLAVIIFSSLSGTIRNARSRDPVDWRIAGLLSAAVAPASLIGNGRSLPASRSLCLPGSWEPPATSRPVSKIPRGC